MAERRPMAGPHPKVAEALELLRQGRMDRRDFIRIVTWLGVGAASAYALAGLPQPARAQAALPFPADDPSAKRNGTVRIAMQVQPLEDPATYAWVQMSNQTRHIVEYLTFTDPDNITKPMLAESWTASDDLKTWTFNLRKGVLWHTGEELISQHVRWNIERWLDPVLGSPNLGLSTFTAMIEEVDTGTKNDKGLPKLEKRAIPGAVSNPDRYTIVFKLAKPVLSVPQDLYNYPCAILHPSFKPPFSDNPIGTGPFRLTELVPAERCILGRVTTTTEGKPFTYWGGDVYLDEIRYIHFDSENQLTAIAAGSTDACWEFGIDQMEYAKSLDGVIVAARTAQTNVVRMQVDQKPFDDIRVRKALAKSIDNAAIKAAVFPEGGDVAYNFHVAPIHPEFFELPPLQRDVEGAKALLKEAGYETLELSVDCGNTEGPWQQVMLEVMREQMREVGIRLTVNVMPAAKYWEIWNQTPFGATSWTHRPLGTMVLSLAYRTGVPWNETHYSNPAFDKALDDAEATLDTEARKAKMELIEKTLQDDAVMLQALWRPVYAMVSKRIRGLGAHPTGYHQLNKVWVD